LRPAQHIGAFPQCKDLQLSAGDDRACDIEFATHRASNADAVECGGDSLCDGAADRTVHVLSPADEMETTQMAACVLLPEQREMLKVDFIPNVIHSIETASPLICHFRDKCAMSNARYI
jgi:hypothetical protein